MSSSHATCVLTTNEICHSDLLWNLILQEQIVELSDKFQWYGEMEAECSFCIIQSVYSSEVIDGLTDMLVYTQVIVLMALLNLSPTYTCISIIQWKYYINDW